MGGARRAPPPACAPWALLHGLTPLGPAGALLLTGACKAALYAAGAACHAPAPPLASGIRVLMTGDSFAPKLDGPQILTNNMVRGLIGMGHAVHVFCSNGYPGIEYGPELAGATVTRGPGVEVFPKHKVTLPSPWFVWALLRCRPHLVHFVDLTPANILTLPVAWLLGIPCVLAHHSRVDVYANYTPSPVCYVAPQVMRLILEVVNMFADGHLLATDAGGAAVVPASAARVLVGRGLRHRALPPGEGRREGEGAVRRRAHRPPARHLRRPDGAREAGRAHPR